VSPRGVSPRLLHFFGKTAFELCGPQGSGLEFRKCANRFLARDDICQEIVGIGTRQILNSRPDPDLTLDLFSIQTYSEPEAL